MKKFVVSCSLLILLAISVSAQKMKPWTEWSEKDTDKVLNDSGWGQTQTEGGSSEGPSQTSAITSTTAAREGEVRNAGAAAKAGESGDKKMPGTVHYRVRFLTAKPIRAAFVRKVELQGAPSERVAQLRSFVDRDFGDYIVITITMEGNDTKRMAPVAQGLTTADLNALKDVTYLERKDGKRVQLVDYRAPTQDGLGAKFVFPRTVEGKPFIEPTSGEVRFAMEMGKAFKINRRFKVADMMYDGKLEF
jgi:hypothetical protein